jgi:hypothetical protein
VRGFAGVDLAPGKSSTVTITMPTSAFTYYNGHSMTVDRGTYTIDVGSSSAQFVASQTMSFA